MNRGDAGAASRTTAGDAALAARARAVRLLSCDVDGVLTDGRVYVDDDGRESRAFHVLDGVGLRRLAAAGIAVAWITGSPSESVVHRAKRLGVEHVFRGSDDKLPSWERLCATLGVAPSACAHIGDDLPDIPLMRACVLAATVPHAPDVVKLSAHYVTSREGGFGAVRELAELILVAQGRA